MFHKFFVTAALSVVGAVSAFAHIEIFEANLSGLNESPPNASPATGFTRTTIDFDLFTMRVEANFSGLMGNTTASHIHVRTPPNLNGGVASMLPSFSGFPLGVTSGSFDQTYNMAVAASYNPAFITNNGGTVSTAFNALVNALRNDLAYLNIHTSAFGGGEIRGNYDAVPEPASMAALGLGLAAVIRRRRK